MDETIQTNYHYKKFLCITTAYLIQIAFHRNETSLVNLELKKGNSKVNHVLYGQGYTLKAHFSQPDGKYETWA